MFLDCFIQVRQWECFTSSLLFLPLVCAITWVYFHSSTEFLVQPNWRLKAKSTKVHVHLVFVRNLMSLENFLHLLALDCIFSFKSSSETQGQIVGMRTRKPEWRRPFGTGLVRHCPQGLFSPFFTFLCAICFSTRLDFSSSPLSAPGSPRMVSSLISCIS